MQQIREQRWYYVIYNVLPSISLLNFDSNISLSLLGFKSRAMTLLSLSKRTLNGIVVNLYSLPRVFSESITWTQLTLSCLIADFQSPNFSSCDIPKISKSSRSYELYNFLNSGFVFLQGPHHEAQNSNKRNLPLSVLLSINSPFSLGRIIFGGIFPASNIFRLLIMFVINSKLPLFWWLVSNFQ